MAPSFSPLEGKVSIHFAIPLCAYDCMHFLCKNPNLMKIKFIKYPCQSVSRLAFLRIVYLDCNQNP